SAVVDGLVSHSRATAGWRGVETLAGPGLAGALHGHRPVRHVGGGAVRRLPRRLNRNERGACAARPGTWPARMAEHLANHNEPPERDDGWQDLAAATPTFLPPRPGSHR